MAKKTKIASPDEAPAGRPKRASGGRPAAKRTRASNAVNHPLDRTEMIRRAAYFRAESRNFLGGSPEQDWLDAEAEIDSLLAREARGSASTR